MRRTAPGCYGEGCAMTDMEEWVGGNADQQLRQRIQGQLQDDPSNIVELMEAAQFEIDLQAVHQRPSTRRYAVSPRRRPRSTRRARRSPFLPLTITAAATLAVAVLALVVFNQDKSPNTPQPMANAPQPAVTGPRALAAGDKILTTDWTEGVQLTLQPGTEVVPDAKNWPFIQSGSVAMQVQPGRSEAIGLSDHRIEAEVLGTSFAIQRGARASLLVVDHGSVGVGKGSTQQG